MLIGIKFMKCDFIYMESSLWAWIFKIAFVFFLFLHIILFSSKNKTRMLLWVKWMRDRTGGQQDSVEAEQGMTRRGTSWFDRLLSAGFLFL